MSPDDTLTVWTTFVRLTVNDDMLNLPDIDVRRRVGTTGNFYASHLGDRTTYISLYIGDPNLVREMDQHYFFNSHGDDPLSLFIFLTKWKKWANEEAVFELQFRLKSGRMHPYFLLNLARTIPPSETVRNFSIWRNSLLHPNKKGYWAYPLNNSTLFLVTSEKEPATIIREGKTLHITDTVNVQMPVERCLA